MSLVELAKKAVETFIKEEKIIQPSKNLTAALGEPRLRRDNFLNKKAGVFVTIEKDGKLRGCIGTYLPTCDNIAKEVIQNAISAATKDYRFSPIQKEELPYLSYTIYVLSKPELVKDIKKLNPEKYGIIVKTATSTGLLLPDLKDIDTIEKQTSIACLKAGINPKKEKILIYKFTVEKYE